MAGLCCLPPGSTSGPAVGGAGSLQPRQLLTSPVRLLSPPSSFPASLHLCWLTGSEVLPCVLPLFSQREMLGESSDSGEDLRFLLHL